MMQSLDVISVNFWNILVSLLNLVILFLLVKQFLFKPVQKMLQKRQDALSETYAEAERAKTEAEDYKVSWNEKMQAARKEADDIIQDAADRAKWRGEKIVEDAKSKANSMLRQAETQAELTRKKAEEGIKQEIIEVSTALAGKMLQREIKAQDHRDLIESMIEQIGEDNDTNQ